MSQNSQNNSFRRFLNPFLAGAGAGLAVDITLFPIDTIKTRLQSPNGFWHSGGFSKIYSGIGSTVVGSAPGAALFFVTYEFGKYVHKDIFKLDPKYNNFSYTVSASFAEICACLIRVPVEVVKQRAQAYNKSSLTVLRQTIQQTGFIGLYRGYYSTIIREVPFSMIQFPLWETNKALWSEWQQSPVKPYQSMICGSMAGGISAFITTPLDNAKTRIMLSGYSQFENQSTSFSSNKSTHVNYFQTIQAIFKQKGIQGLFAGAVPRVLWISIGGAIFLGGYDKINSLLK